MDGQIDMEQKGYELIQLFDPTDNIDLKFSRSDFEIAWSWEWVVQLAQNKRDINW